MKISDLYGRIGYHLDKEDLEIDENETIKGLSKRIDKFKTLLLDKKLDYNITLIKDFWES